MIESYTKIFEWYCSLLHASLNAKQINKKLFLARGGLRLRRLYEKRYPNSNEENLDFYTSRLAVIKAATHIAPEITAIEIAKEYYGLTMYEMLACFIGQDKFNSYCQEIDSDKLSELKQTIVSEAEIAKLFEFQNDSYLRTIVGEQYRLLRKYWSQHVNQDDNVALIDTGWSGTIVFYLKLLFPSYNINAFFFGKSTYGQKTFDYHRFVHGVMFDSNKTHSNQGFSYLIENRHVIEMICEPNFPSTEAYVDNEGKVLPSCGLASEEQIIGKEGDVYSEIYHAVGNNYGSYRESYVRELRSATLWPRKSDVASLASVSRSADFGKDLKVKLLYPSSMNLKKKAKNIRRSLWYQGQIVEEFGGLGRAALYINYQVLPYIPWFRRFAR